MHMPEYLELFSNNGSMRVEVRFMDRRVSVAKQSMQEDELSGLIDPATGKLYRRMLFDEWPFEVLGYEIDLEKGRLVIKAKALASGDDHE